MTKRRRIAEACSTHSGFWLACEPALPWQSPSRIKTDSAGFELRLLANRLVCLREQVIPTPPPPSEKESPRLRGSPVHRIEPGPQGLLSLRRASGRVRQTSL